ncbi:serine/threonine protein kinase [Paenibacillus chartarius]|uniref:Serine/threonine protein kinase n=1 Tax=Paenibacillus chartarius TaxID=747481 RepID=A0ABV6DG16_9BACL
MLSYWRRFIQTWIDYPLRPGTLLASRRYRIERMLGAGSYGLSYLCTDVRQGGPVVVKQAKPSKGRLGKQLLKREAELMGMLEHPAIPKLYGTFSQRKHDFLVMEYVEGDTVEQLVFDRGAAFSELDSLRIVRRLTDVVLYIHERGIVHLDLRIPNIIWRGEELKVIDFGLARRIGDRSGLAGGGMDEEMLRRRSPEPRSDLYALGHVLLYILYTSYPEPSADGQTTADDAGWEEELTLAPATRRLLRKLLQIEAPYGDGLSLASDLERAIQELE